jgi:hypothetical protein
MMNCHGAAILNNSGLNRRFQTKTASDPGLDLHEVQLSVKHSFIVEHRNPMLAHEQQLNLLLLFLSWVKYHSRAAL